LLVGETPLKVLGMDIEHGELRSSINLKMWSATEIEVGKGRLPNRDALISPPIIGDFAEFSICLSTSFYRSKINFDVFKNVEKNHAPISGKLTQNLVILKDH